MGKAFGTGDELWEADWQARSGAPSFTITKQMAPGIAPSQPAAAKQAYRPPGARGTQSTFKLHDDDEALAAAANHAKEIKEQTYQGARGILADPQREKKARKVMDKLAKINKLKEEAAGGKQLEKNQLEMISKEQELAEELKMLQL